MTNAVTVAIRYSTRKSRSRIWVSFRLGVTKNESREGRREFASPHRGFPAPEPDSRDQSPFGGRRLRGTAPRFQSKCCGAFPRSVRGGHAFPKASSCLG